MSNFEPKKIDISKINDGKGKYNNGDGIQAETINALVEGVAFAQESGGTSITVDSELSDTSTNPVQNKVVKEALDGKLNAVITPDEHEYTRTRVYAVSGDGKTQFVIPTSGSDSVARRNGWSLLENDMVSFKHANDNTCTPKKYVDDEIAKMSGGGTSGLFIVDEQFPNGLTQSTATALATHLSTTEEIPFIAISNGKDGSDENGFTGIVTGYKRQSNITRVVWITIGSKVYEYGLTATDPTYVEFTATAPYIYDLSDIGDMKTALDAIIEIQNSLIGGNS